MRILVGCEESQAVCIEFRKRGHEAYSCDIQPCSGGHPEWHIQGDVFEVIASGKWDFIGIHPPCTAMAISGNRHYASGKPKHELRVSAIEWTVLLWKLATSVSEKVYMENPLGAINSDIRLPKPQIIQPYHYGHEARKTTCLWLHGLPKLTPTNIVAPKIITLANGKTFSEDYLKGVNRSKSGDSSTKRSKTYSGIARAMATQWG